MQTEIANAKQKYRNVLKRILKTNLSTNEATLNRYKFDLIKEFNNFSVRLDSLFVVGDISDKAIIRDNFLYGIIKLKEGYVDLNWKLLYLQLLVNK